MEYQDNKAAVAGLLKALGTKKQANILEELRITGATVWLDEAGQLRAAGLNDVTRAQLRDNKEAVMRLLEGFPDVLSLPAWDEGRFKEFMARARLAFTALWPEMQKSDEAFQVAMGEVLLDGLILMSEAISSRAMYHSLMAVDRVMNLCNVLKQRLPELKKEVKEVRKAS